MAYTAMRCPCGHVACTSWQVKGIAPEAKFTGRQARAVAALLNMMEQHPDDRIYARVVPADASREDGRLV